MIKYLFEGKSIKTGEIITGNYNNVNGKSYINPTKGDLEDCDYGYGFEEVSMESVKKVGSIGGTGMDDIKEECKCCKDGKITATLPAYKSMIRGDEHSDHGEIKFQIPFPFCPMCGRKL